VQCHRGVSFWFRHRNTCIAHLVRGRLQAGEFLDVGGGNGSTTKSLVAAGIDCWLIEPNPAGCRNAQDRGIQAIFLANLDALCFPNDSVAGVGLFDVIEHIEDTSELLSEAYRITAPNGILAVTVPAIPWPWSTEDEYAGHFRRYARRTLRQELTSVGFEVEITQYLFGPLAFLWSIGLAAPCMPLNTIANGSSSRRQLGNCSSRTRC
jgi:ubiquinone/menaquinone biosynthesis C-methylase UbiE